MSKRATQFARRERDFYRTPESALMPLLKHLHGVKTFYAPCAGDGYLADNLVKHGFKCVGMSDIEPLRSDILGLDALDLYDVQADCIIENPPWTREILHPMILRFQAIAPTWLLFDADWIHTRQAVPFIDQCSHIVSVGRVKWIKDSKFTGKDNAAWHRFHVQHSGGPRFFAREAVAA